MAHDPGSPLTISIASLALVLLAARCPAEEAPAQFGLEAGGGYAGFELKDFAAAALGRDGVADVAGWTVGGRALFFLPMGLGFSAGFVDEGGVEYAGTVQGYSRKKATTLTRAIKASYSERCVPVSLHYRIRVREVDVGLEAGVDFTAATIAYAEFDSNGGYVNGDLKQTGTGFHLAVDGSMKFTKALWGYMRLGYFGLSLKDFEGVLDDGGTLKTEKLFMVRNAYAAPEDLEVSTSDSSTSNDHRPAEVGGAGLRLTIGIRVLFP